MLFRCAGITSGTINGIGISLEVWFQGCKFSCPGCQNPDLQNLDGGQLIDTDVVLEHLNNYKDFYNSIVFLGGEPVLQPKSLNSIITNCNIPSILYTGFLYEELPEDIQNAMDFIVDGTYNQELKINGFPATSNQRIWHNGKIIHKDFRKNYNASTNNI
jgi:anaerobic ribonucleoside-triphosphate reductase activating protein